MKESQPSIRMGLPDKYWIPGLGTRKGKDEDYNKYTQTKRPKDAKKKGLMNKKIAGFSLPAIGVILIVLYALYKVIE